MSNDNWLIKLCSEQPTNEAELEQALTEMPPEQLMSLDPTPTPGIDSMESKIAFADQMGREMAIQNPGILSDAENQALVANLSDEEAVKLAHDLGIRLEKKAFLGGLAAKATKWMAGSGGKKLTGAIAKNPNAATAALGAGAGAVHSKATGGSALGGAMAGGALGYGAGRLGAGQMLKSRTSQAYGAARKAQGPLSAGIGKTASIKKVLMGMKTAMRNNDKNEWLEQFEGSPLLQAALDMAKQELASETADIEQRAARRAERKAEPDYEDNSSYDEQEKLKLQKKDLELQLIAQRNGLGSEGGEPGSAEDGMPPAEPAPEEGGEVSNPAQATIESPAGQEAVGAIKEAGWKLAARGVTAGMSFFKQANMPVAAPAPVGRPPTTAKPRTPNLATGMAQRALSPISTKVAELKSKTASELIERLKKLDINKPKKAGVGGEGGGGSVDDQGYA